MREPTVGYRPPVINKCAALMATGVALAALAMMLEMAGTPALALMLTCICAAVVWVAGVIQGVGDAVYALTRRTR